MAGGLPSEANACSWMSASLLPPFSPSALSPSCLLVLYFTPSTEREKRERERERESGSQKQNGFIQE
jgi:hypothetical protein